MTRYETEIYEPHRDPPELQVMHKYPMAEPETEAAQLGGSGPRPDQHHREDRSMSTATTWAPTRPELDEVTARTKAAIDGHASLAEVEHLAEIEEAAHKAYLTRPGADAELQADAERELREYEMEAGG